jgi:hypothetical protein
MLNLVLKITAHRELPVRKGRPLCACPLIFFQPKLNVSIAQSADGTVDTDAVLKYFSEKRSDSDPWKAKLLQHIKELKPLSDCKPNQFLNSRVKRNSLHRRSRSVQQRYHMLRQERDRRTTHPDSAPSTRRHRHVPTVCRQHQM